MNELALFAGAGGGILGGMLLGWRTVAAVEIEDYPRRVLLQRQADGVLPRFPVWDDVRTFDGKQWRGKVDVISGGFPCQDISAAGKGAGITGERSGLWSEFSRIIGEVRPKFVFVENSPLLKSRGLDVVLADLAAMGYDAKWGIIGAHHAGAPHKRDRIWILANASKDTTMAKPGSIGAGDIYRKADDEIWRSRGEYVSTLRQDHRKDGSDRTHTAGAGEGEAVANATEQKRPKRGQQKRALSKLLEKPGAPGIWTSEPDVGRVAHGVAARVDRLKAIGNGQVPAVAALAWRILNNGTKL
jgi:DNA (cytosine-5)-methyltransferase 1